MNLPRLLSILAVSGSLLLSPETSAAEEEGWVRLDPESLPPEWTTFREAVTKRPWAAADFTEHRHFRFRRQPVELSGTVWFGRKEGLTLSYKEPREEIMRIDEDGARIIRDGRGREPGIPERARDVPGALLALFRLDFEELGELFAIEGRREGETWSLRMTPHHEDRAPIQRIKLEGRGEDITRIEIEQNRSRRIELAFSNPVYPDSLDDEERARLFP